MDKFETNLQGVRGEFNEEMYRGAPRGPTSPHLSGSNTSERFGYCTLRRNCGDGHGEGSKQTDRQTERVGEGTIIQSSPVVIESDPNDVLEGFVGGSEVRTTERYLSKRCDNSPLSVFSVSKHPCDD